MAHSSAVSLSTSTSSPPPRCAMPPYAAHPASSRHPACVLPVVTSYETCADGIDARGSDGELAERVGKQTGNGRREARLRMTSDLARHRSVAHLEPLGVLVEPLGSRV